MPVRSHIGSIAFVALFGAWPVHAQDALSWVQDGLGFTTTRHDAGTWVPAGGKVHATDPLTLWQAGHTPYSVPDKPAKVLGLLETEQGRAAAMLLQWSNGPVVCGHDLGSIGVDTGLAGIMTPADVAALESYGEAFDGDLYAGTYAAQLDSRIPTIPFIVELPDGTRFPVTGSGWGDGGYPVVSLLDAEGKMLALYVQFITGGTWHLPPSCPQITG